jgi:hypothetical protein
MAMMVMAFETLPQELISHIVYFLDNDVSSLISLRGITPIMDIELVRKCLQLPISDDDKNALDLISFWEITDSWYVRHALEIMLVDMIPFMSIPILLKTKRTIPQLWRKATAKFKNIINHCEDLNLMLLLVDEMRNAVIHRFTQVTELTYTCESELHTSRCRLTDSMLAMMKKLRIYREICNNQYKCVLQFNENQQLTHISLADFVTVAYILSIPNDWSFVVRLRINSVALFNNLIKSKRWLG